MTSDECPISDCHFTRDEYDDDLYKHLRLYHSKEELAKFIFDLDLNNKVHNQHYYNNEIYKDNQV